MFFDETIFLSLAIFLAVVLSIPLIIFPAVIKATHRHTATPEFMTFDPNNEDTPAEVANYIFDVEEQLAPHGFKSVAYLYCDNHVPRVGAFLGMFYQEAERVGAGAMVFYATGIQSKLAAKFVGISSKFTDDSIIATQNDSTVRIFAAVPARQIFKFPSVEDAGRLYQIHLGLLRMFNPGLPLKNLLDDHPAAVMRRAILRELNEQVGTGYYYPDEADDSYRLTWKGAFLITWKMLWPFSALLRSRDRRYAKILLRELSLDLA
jgi:hypothetical protein